jgi:type IV pilus assembly protein PilA
MRSRANHFGSHASRGDTSSIARRTRLGARGFTLVELLVVVAMVGVLSALAILGYRKYLATSHTAEARAVIQGIRAGEEAYRAETLVYLGCTALVLTPLYPNATPDTSKWNWNRPGDPLFDNCFSLLNVTTDGPVRFGYAVAAGLPSQTPPQPGAGPFGAVTYPTLRGPWYVVLAQGDPEGENRNYFFYSSSFSGEIAEGKN